ncbi:chromosome-anchoring protein RacA [Bacillus sp. NPDC077027]|uniref:chromosome-anchoring protein RacA n=1 Tax=Bacillus sp. NPDC077027 TaxID=3390548 RepID=UPI003D081EB7
MTTSEVAKEFDVSVKTIQRWVKQLHIPVSRNELGHYEFDEETLTLLKQVKQQMNEGVLLQDIRLSIDGETSIQLAPSRETDDHSQKIAALEQTIKQILHQQSQYTEIELRLKDIERKLAKKADEGVSYQLLQHRREIEELATCLEKLTNDEGNKKHLVEDKETVRAEVKKKRVLFPLFNSFR